MSERSTAEAPAAEEAIDAAAMPTSRKLLCALYATIAIAGLFGTYSQGIAYFTGVLDIIPSFVHFFVDTKVTPASRFVLVETVSFFLAGSIFMVIEARKHSIRFVWAYITVAGILALSVGFPLFLIARELCRPTSDATHLKVVDIVSLAPVAAVCTGLIIFVFVL
jgi:hypothetical protein